MPELRIAVGSKRRLESVHWQTEHRSGQECTVIKRYRSVNFPGRFRYVVEFADGKQALVAESQLMAVKP